MAWIMPVEGVTAVKLSHLSFLQISVSLISYEVGSSLSVWDKK